MSETIIIKDLVFELRRSNNRKTVCITVDRKGELILSIPDGFPTNNLEKIVHEKRFWIYTKLAEKEMLLHSARKREFVSGEGFLYLGRSYRLKIVDPVDGQPPLKLFHGRFWLNKHEVANAKRDFIEWYVSHAGPWFQHRVEQYQDRIGVKPGQIKVQDLGSRWASCGKNGNLNFHWRTILLPPTIIEYIVVHELVHLLEPHHTPEFWRKVERVIPDYTSRKKWLAENGVKADL